MHGVKATRDLWLNIRVTEEEKERLLELSARNDRTLAAQARVLIREGLEREQEKAAA